MLNPIHTKPHVNYTCELNKKNLKNKADLIKVIKGLENDIVDGSWHKKAYAEMDLEMMSSMIFRANKKYPNLHLEFLNNPRDIGVLIEKMILQGRQSIRCIVNMGEEGIHCAVIEGRVMNNTISLILFDSSSKQHNGSNLLALRLTLALKRHSLPEYFLTLFAMDIQRSISECGIFSLALAKKLHRESEQIKIIHQDNVSGKFKEQFGFIPYHEIDKYLPPSFFRYAQSINRLNEYVDAYSKSRGSLVKEKCSNIIERFFKNLVSVGNKKMSVSLHKKRIAEYSALVKI